MLVTDRTARDLAACVAISTRPPGTVVAQRVVDQVRGQPLGQPRAARRQRGAERGRNGQVPVAALGPAGSHDLAGHVGQVEGLVRVEACLAAGQGEQRIDELLLLGAGGQDPLVGGAQGVDAGRRDRPGRPG